MRNATKTVEDYYVQSAKDIGLVDSDGCIRFTRISIPEDCVVNILQYIDDWERMLLLTRVSKKFI